MENTIHLTTHRLTLREFRDSDWKAVHTWDADPDVVRYLTWDCERTESAAREWVSQQIAHSREEPRLEYGFIIVLKEDKQPIGVIELHLRVDQASAWVTYRLHSAYRGRGYATEALRCVLRFGFGSLGLHRIKGSAHSANIASCRVLEKSGMRYEGVQPAWDWHDELVEEAHYALLDREWATLRAEPAFTPRTRGTAGTARTTKWPDTRPGTLGFGLTTAQLYLRSFEEDDWELFHSHAPFYSVTVSPHHPLSRPSGLSEHAARDYVAASMKQPNDQLGGQSAFVVVRREDDRGSGAISLAVSEDGRSGWIEYHLHPDIVHRDDAPEALQAILRFGLGQDSLQWIGADCWAHDPLGMRILEAAGMNQEAIFVDAIQVDGAWRSSASYAAFLED